MRKYAVLGVPGSGKSTQSALLARELDLTRISTGDDFRWHVKNHTKIGARVGSSMAAGRLVDDDLVWSVVRGRLEQHDWNHGFVIDGFPRNVRQAELLLESHDLDAVVYLEIPDSRARERALSRRRCDRCGPIEDARETCGTCGGPLTTREDDAPETLAERIRDHRRNIAPALESLRRRVEVVVIDAGRAPDTVHREIRVLAGLR